MDHRPSILRIIQNDYLAFIGAAFPVILSAMFFFLSVTRGGENQNLIYTAGLTTILGVSVVVWRVRLISGAFEACVEVQATISEINFFRDRGRVEYSYLHQGQKYASGNAIMKNKRTQALAVGQKVTLVVDRDHPKRAFIRDLYV